MGLGDKGGRSYRFSVSKLGGLGREVIQKIWGPEVPGSDVSKFGPVGDSEVTGNWRGSVSEVVVM